MIFVEILKLFNTNLLSFLITLGIFVIWMIIFSRTFSCYKSYMTNTRTNNKSEIRSAYLKNLPSVSIIIPARNEEVNIERCLLSIVNQNYPEFEVIVIDDNSNDNTVQKARALQQKIKPKFQNLKIILDVFFLLLFIHL